MRYNSLGVVRLLMLQYNQLPQRLFLSMLVDLVSKLGQTMHSVRLFTTCHTKLLKCDICYESPQSLSLVMWLVARRSNGSMHVQQMHMTNYRKHSEILI